jgi:hypothetical protein
MTAGTSDLGGGYGGNILLEAGGSSSNYDGGDVTIRSGTAGAGAVDGYIIFQRGSSEVARWDNGGSERLLMQTHVVEFDKSLQDGVKIWQPPPDVAMDGYDLTIRAQDAGAYGFQSGALILSSGSGNNPGHSAQSPVKFQLGGDDRAKITYTGFVFADYTDNYIYPESKTIGNGSNIHIIAGTTNGTGFGGELTLEGGNSASNKGGDVTIESGVCISGASPTGTVTIKSGIPVNSGSSGNISISSAPAGSTSNGTSGILLLSTGNGNGTGNAGSLTVRAGNGGTTSGDGGTVTVQAGTGGGTGEDGYVNLQVGSTKIVGVSSSSVSAEAPIMMKEVSDPGTPPPGYWYLWADSSDGRVKLRDDNDTTTPLTP